MDVEALRELVTVILMLTRHGRREAAALWRSREVVVERWEEKACHKAN